MNSNQNLNFRHASQHRAALPPPLLPPLRGSDPTQDVTILFPDRWLAHGIVVGRVSAKDCMQRGRCNEVNMLSPRNCVTRAHSERMPKLLS